MNYRTNNTTLNSFYVDVKNQLTNSTPSGVNQFDGNGNLTNYNSTGIAIAYTYDDENQLTRGENVTKHTWATDFVYDGRGRLRQRLESVWAGGVWTLYTTTRYLYDGMRVIQERDGSNVPQVSYTRGTDLSGSLEGAGGIGGLLARSHGYSGGNWSTHNYYHADGNGNITYLVNGSQGLAAKYRYDPYGSAISSSGSLASANVYRFSSKELHVNSGLYYYGYRWYHPNQQRWPNRDPINEIGFNLLIRSQNPFNLDEEKNLYGFVRNSPVGLVDSDGRIVPILIVAGWAAWQAACTIHAANKAVETFPTDDKKQHCMASCVHSRCTGLFQDYWNVLGNIWGDILVGEPEIRDQGAGLYGTLMAHNIFRSCEESCRKCPIK